MSEHKRLIEQLSGQSVSVIVTAESISVSLVGGCARGVVALDLLADRWWLSRAVINPREHRGGRLGTILLKRALQEVASSSVRRVVVQPGGYEGNTIEQFNFYLKNGFCRTDDPTMLTWTGK
jgi:hypothetical protein